jgi:hypothetical protein
LRKPRERIMPRPGDTQFFHYDLDGLGVELSRAGLTCFDKSCPSANDVYAQHPNAKNRHSRQGPDCAISRARVGQGFFIIA